MTPLYTIGIAVHNQLHLTKKCLESMVVTGDTEIIVVDNASTDGSQEYLSQWFGEGRNVIWLNENRGVGAAYNKAFQYAQAPYFVTLNNDVEILDPDWLEKMREKFEEDPKMGAVGIDAPDVCWSIDQNGHGYQGKEFEYVEGAVMMVRKEIVKSLEGGLFDPIYRFAYFEDNDLSLRLRRAGYHIGKVKVKVKHQRCGTVGAVIQQGVDVDGFHRINEEIYKERWGNYIRNRNFQEVWSIRRSGAIGDVLFLTPILREIKKRNAEAEIIVHTNYPDALTENPDIFGMGLPFGYETCPAYHRIDLDGAYESRSNMHIIEAYQEVCGVKTKDWKLRLYPGEEARRKAKEATWNEPYAVIHPHIGQYWLGRNPQENLFVEVSNYLRGRGFKAVLAGIIYTPGIPCDLNVEGKTTLREAAAIIEGAGLFFGVDSALMNFAQALEVPTVGVFGCMNPKNILVPGANAVALTARPLEVGCLGCHTMYKERPKGSPGRCVREQGDVCMRKIRTEDAVSAIEKVLSAV